MFLVCFSLLFSDVFSISVLFVLGNFKIYILFAMPGPLSFRLCITADMLFAVLQFNLCFRFFLGSLDCYF